MERECCDELIPKERCPFLIYLAGVFYSLPLVWAVMLTIRFLPSRFLIPPFALITILSIVGISARLGLMRWILICSTAVAVAVYIYCQFRFAHDGRGDALIISMSDFINAGSEIYAVLTAPGAVLLLLTPSARRWFADDAGE